jgi:hypothetical protein
MFTYHNTEGAELTATKPRHSKEKLQQCFGYHVSMPKMEEIRYNSVHPRLGHYIEVDRQVLASAG